MLITEPRAGAAHATNDLIDMQQYIIFAANFLNALPIAFGRGDHTTASCYRLKTNGADCVRTFAQNNLLNGICSAFPIVFDIPLFAIFQTMRDFHKAGRIGAIMRVAFFLTARR